MMSRLDTDSPRAAADPPRAGLPLAGLLALATAGFITILTEALPAGLLPQMSAGLDASASRIGQLVTIYAIGSLLAAIPLTTLTRHWPRRPLLLTAIAGFALVNTITAVSTVYGVTLVARFFAGVFAGLLWALLAGYALRMVPEAQKGRALAVAMLGAPVALSLGIPAGTLLGTLVGWRYAFAIMSLLTVVLVVWVRAKVPPLPGEAAEEGDSLGRVFTLPGLSAVLFCTLAFVFGHSLLYTYIAPFLARAGMAARVDVVLFVFGAASLIGIWIVGVLIDRRLRGIVLTSTAAFALSVLALAMGGGVPAVLFGAVALWGLAFGGAGTMFQAASAQAAGRAADIAQSMIVTVWNIAIAGGALAGGLLLDTQGAGSLPWAALVLVLAALAVSAAARRHGFPRIPAAPRDVVIRHDSCSRPPAIEPQY